MTGPEGKRPCLLPEDFGTVVVGPDDLLVMVLKVPASHEQIAQWRGRIPQEWAGRVLIVDADAFDLAVVEKGTS